MIDALDSNWVAPVGPEIDAFEREFAERVGAPHAVALASGTAALHLGLIAAGVRPGDCVITSTLTFVATANAIRHAGATPVFVDCDRGTWNLDPELVAYAAGRLTASGRRVAAVAPVDLLGQPADYETLREIAGRYHVKLVADAAESLGATYRDRPTAATADMACYSFNGNKIITTSGGGMLVARSGAYAERVRLLATQARLPGPQYRHNEVGYNYRLSNLLAALGRSQLADLDRRVERRREVFGRYQAALAETPGLEFMPQAPHGRSTRWLTCMLIEPERTRCTPEQVRLALEERNIESRPLWKPMHLQPAHASELISRGRTPVAEDLWRRGLCLPSGSSLSDEDQQRVIDALRAALGRARPATHRAAPATLKAA